MSGVLSFEPPRPTTRRSQEKVRLAKVGVRRQKGLLVLGDERVRSLAAEAPQRIGRDVAAVVAEPEDAFHHSWDELLIDAPSLERIREAHPAILRQARRVWVVAHEGQAHPLGNPFKHPFPGAWRFLKRTIDIVLASVGLLLVLPVLLAAMVAVCSDSPGPALFKQVRMGANGRRFRLYKLRTMYQGNDDRAHRQYVARLIAGAEERHGDIYKLVHDPRITRVGRFLRHFSIDEVPQLWNVLKGDMSLVGPRPALPHETELYSAYAWARLRVKPGVTGLWQVSGRCALSFDEMVSLDVGYWQNWTLWSDLRILLKTPRTVLTGKGAA